MSADQMDAPAVVESSRDIAGDVEQTHSPATNDCDGVVGHAGTARAATQGLELCPPVTTQSHAGSNPARSQPESPTVLTRDRDEFRAYAMTDLYLGKVSRRYVAFGNGQRRWFAQPFWGVPELGPFTSSKKAGDALWEAYQRAFVELPPETDWEHDDLCRAVRE